MTAFHTALSNAKYAFVALVFFELLVPSRALARSPEDHLRICIRDGERILKSIRKDPKRYATRLEGQDMRCISGDKAQPIQHLPGYERVLELHRQAHAVLATSNQREAADADAARGAAIAAGPGGTEKAIDARWSARPKRCRAQGEWVKPDTLAFQSRYASPTAGAHAGSKGRGPGANLLAVACGDGVHGVQAGAKNNDMFFAQMLQGDPRIVLGSTVMTMRGDGKTGPEYHAYQVALIQRCFHATRWLKMHEYPAYAYCRFAVGVPPTPDEVDMAVRTGFPNRPYEQDNLRYAFEQGITALKATEAKFAEHEKRYPNARKVFFEAAAEAERRFIRERGASASFRKTLDPMTRSLEADLDAPLPENCDQELMRLRVKLAKQLKPRDEKGVRLLKAKHPVGYAITETLAACYLRQGKIARAKAEISALRFGLRQMNAAESAIAARLTAIEKLRAKLKSAGRIKAAVPSYETEYFTPQAPPTWSLASFLRSKIDQQGSFEILGATEEAPAVVASHEKRPDGVRVTFKKHTLVRHRRDIKCTKTNRVQRYDIVGSSVHPVYEENCRQVGPSKKEKLVYQEKPVVLSAADAKVAKKGLQIRVLRNKHAVGDTSLLDVWHPKKGHGKATMIDGIKLR